jgi:hypothetical protein
VAIQFAESPVRRRRRGPPTATNQALGPPFLNVRVQRSVESDRCRAVRITAAKAGPRLPTRCKYGEAASASLNLAATRGVQRDHEIAQASRAKRPASTAREGRLEPRDRSSCNNCYPIHSFARAHPAHNLSSSPIPVFVGDQSRWSGDWRVGTASEERSKGQCHSFDLRAAGLKTCPRLGLLEPNSGRPGPVKRGVLCSSYSSLPGLSPELPREDPDGLAANRLAIGLRPSRKVRTVGQEYSSAFGIPRRHQDNQR